MSPLKLLPFLAMLATIRAAVVFFSSPSWSVSIHCIAWDKILPSSNSFWRQVSWWKYRVCAWERRGLQWTLSKHCRNPAKNLRPHLGALSDNTCKSWTFSFSYSLCTSTRERTGLNSCAIMYLAICRIYLDVSGSLSYYTATYCIVSHTHDGRWAICYTPLDCCWR